MGNFILQHNPVNFPALVWFRRTFCTCIAIGAFTLYLFTGLYQSLHPLLYHVTKTNPDFKCIWSVVDNRTKCKPVCGYGYFGLYGMEDCHLWLDCEDMKNIEGAERIPSGTAGLVKEVGIGKWNGYDVVIKKMRRYHYGRLSHKEFEHGVQILKDFSSQSEILQLVGQCNQTIITEYHALADATNLEKHMGQYKRYNNISTRFQLCIDFVRIMTIFHSGQGGKVYAHCDGNEVHILLWQFLLTDDFRLVISDVDALVDLEILNCVTKKKVCPVESRNYSVPTRKSTSGRSRMFARYFFITSILKQ